MLSKFTAKIKANHKNFMKKIAEAQAAAKDLQDNIQVKIKADVSDALKDMVAIQQIARDLNGETVKIDVDVSTAGALTQMELIQQRMRDMQDNMNNIRIKIFANAKQFFKTMQRVKAMLLELKDDSITIEIKANITHFRKMLLLARTLAQNFERNDVNVDIQGRHSDLMQAIVESKMALLTIRDKVVNIKGDNRSLLRSITQANASTRNMGRNYNLFGVIAEQWNKFTGAMQKYAVVVRALGEAGQQMLVGSMVAMLPSLVPIVSSLIGLVGHLGVMLGVVATSAFALVTAFGAAAIAAGGFAAVAIPTIKALFEENAKLTAQQQVARDSFDKMKKTYEGLVKATEAPVLQAFTYAMEAADKILQQLSPMIQSTAQAVAGLMSSFNASIDSKPIQDFFAFLNKDAAGILTTLGQGLGYFLQGLLNMMTAFAPLAVDTAAGFREMGQGFAEWAAGLQNSERFQALMDYVRENMPLIRQAFGDAIVGIVEFFTAFSGQSEGFIQGFANMMSSFREWSSALGENEGFQKFLSYIAESAPKVLAFIGNLWNMLLALGNAMAPVGNMMLDLANSFMSFFTETLNGSKILQTLVGIFPVVLGVFTAGVPIFIAIKTQFNLLWGIFTKVGGFLPKLGSAFSTLIGWIMRLGPVITNVFNWFSKIIPVVMNLASRALPFLVRGFALLSGPIGIAISIITTLITFGIALYKNWETISTKASEIWNGIKEYINGAWEGIKTFLSGIDLSEIGKNIMQGLVNGIKSIPIVGSVIEIGEQIAGAFTKFFKIKSPSRLMADISKFIPEGVAKGINGSLGIVNIAANNLGKAAIPNFKQAIAPTQAMMKQVESVITGSHRKTQSEVAKIEKEYAQKRKESSTKANSEIAAIQKKADSENKYLSQKQQEQITKLQQSSAEQRAKYTQQEAEKIAKIRKGSQSDVLSALESFANQQIELEAWTTKEQAEYWMQAQKAFKDGTEERIKAQINYNKASKALSQEQFNNEKTLMDKLVKYNRLSLTDQVKAYQVYMKQYAQGSDERIYYEEKVYDTQKEIHDKVQSLTDDYISKQKELVQKQKDGEKQIREEQLKTFNDRKAQVRDSFGLFDEVKLTEMIEYDKNGNVTKKVDLIGNLEDQVDTMYAWIEDLQSLTAKGLDSALIEELQKLGVKSAAEIDALANMTESQLAEYQDLWNMKNALAETQTRIEMPKFEDATDMKVAEFNAGIAKEMDELKSQYAKDVHEIRYGAENEFNLLNTSLPDIGKSAMTKLIDSMRAMESPLKAQMTNIADILRNTFTDVFGIGDSMTALDSGLLGVNPALTSTTNVNPSISQGNIERETGSIAEQQAPIVNVDVNWTGEDVRVYVNKENAKDDRLKNYKRG